MNVLYKGQTSSIPEGLSAEQADNFAKTVWPELNTIAHTVATVDGQYVITTLAPAAPAEKFVRYMGQEFKVPGSMSDQEAFQTACGLWNELGDGKGTYAVNGNIIHCSLKAQSKSADQRTVRYGVQTINVPSTLSDAQAFGAACSVWNELADGKGTYAIGSDGSLTCSLKAQSKSADQRTVRYGVQTINVPSTLSDAQAFGAACSVWNELADGKGTYAIGSDGSLTCSLKAQSKSI